MKRPIFPAAVRSGRRPLLIALLLCAAWLALSAPSASADGIIIPRPPPDRPLPWREIPLTVKYHRVEVTIQDQVATTRVDQVFVNDAAYVIEGTYIFPLPEDAAITSFDMWVDGQKLEGRVLNREQARAIYEEIVRRERDPALLEYVGRGAFRASIFPIPPRAERRVQLTYSQALPVEAGMAHYRYPLNTEKFSARPLTEAAITVRLADKSQLRAIYSPSHPVEVRREGDRQATVSYAAQNVRPDRDFDLFYSTAGQEPSGTVANLLSYKPFDEDGFFLLLVTPPIQPPAGARVDRDVILVLDTSGSMEGAKLQQAQAAATYVLDHLAAGDRYNIVAFGTATRLFAPAAVPAARRTEGVDFIKRLTAQGSTDINRALLEALAGADPARPTVLIFLTDGLPTAGEVNPERIVANVARNAAKSVRLFAFGVGDDVDAVLLDQLSRDQRGASAYVRPGQRIDEELSGFYAKISAPVLVDVTLEFTGVGVEDIYPYPLPDLYAGSQLVIAGRYRAGGAATLRLSGAVNGQPQSLVYRDLAFASRGGAEFIAPLWAQRKIGYLLAQIRLNGAKTELVQEVIALSTRYGIVTPYTSFLVQEPTLALTQGGREQLGRTLMTPAPAPSGGAAAPSVLAPSSRSGAQAVERAAAEKALQDNSQAAPAAGPAVNQVRQVGDRAFVLIGGVWQDTAFDAARMRAEPIAFGSERYFQLLGQQPEIGRYLALGDRVIVVAAGAAYAIGPEGAAAPQAAPTPLPSAPPAATRAPTARPSASAPPPVSPGPTPATPAPALPPLCPGAAVGLIGLAWPLWRWRRRA
jgi:Ca-activated chloride channel family protein